MRLRPWRTVVAVGLVLIVFQPPVGAQTIVPSIESVSPDVIVAGSEATVVTVTGDGFADDDLGAAGYESRAWIDGSYVETRVLGDRELEATLPEDMLAVPDTLSLRVVNGAAAAGTFIPLVQSNPVQINVSSAPPHELSVEVEASQDVRDCFFVRFGIPHDHSHSSPSEPATVVITSDDLETPVPDDGGVTFYTDYCDGEPVEGPLTVQNLSYGSVFARSERPSTVEIRVQSDDDPPLSGSSGPVRILGGYVSGRVVDESGVGVGGIEIYAPFEWQSFSETHEPFRWRSNRHTDFCGDPWPGGAIAFLLGFGLPGDAVAVTNPDGTYASAAIAVGDHRILFRAPASAGLASEWYGDVVRPSEAAEVPVTDRDDTAGIDAVLSVGGTLSGSVTDMSGQPLAGAEVLVTDTATQRPVERALTDPDGSFRTVGLAEDSYLLLVDPRGSDVVQRWYGDVRHPADAQSVAVTPSADVSIGTMALPHGSVVSGYVRGAGSLDPIPARITVYDVESGTPRAAGWTDGGEPFRTSPGLPAGDYRIKIEPFDRAYPMVWHGNAEQFSGAETVSLDTAEEHSMDLVVSPGASFTGRVTGDRTTVLGLRLPGPADARVSVHDADTGEYVGGACADSAGRYTTTGLPAGRYQLRFAAEFRRDLAPEWHENARTRAEAEVIEISRGAQLTVDAHLGPGSVLTGTIDRADARPASDVLVEAFSDLDDSLVDWTFTRSDGSYELTGLAEGPYRIRAMGYYYDYERRLPTTWYPGVATRSEAEAIEVGGVVASRADFSLGRPSFITGAVSGVDHRSYTSIDVLDPNTLEVLSWAWVRGDGTYRTTPLHAGRYIVRFRGPGDRALEYYGDAGSAAEAARVDVPDGGTASGIDAALDPGTHIAGAAYAAHSGAPIPVIEVRIVDADTGELLSGAFTWGHGTFETRDLKPGTYKVEFVPADVYQAEWFDGAPSFEDATPIVLDGTADVSVIDATLELR